MVPFAAWNLYSFANGVYIPFQFLDLVFVWVELYITLYFLSFIARMCIFIYWF
jgi:hypothetical protein